MKELLEQAEALSGELVRWRRHIHENPEVGADHILERLSSLLSCLKMRN